MHHLGRTGGSLVSRPPLFSACSKWLFVPVGAKVKVVAVETGDVVRVLYSPLPGDITQLRLNPLAPMTQILASSVEGAVLVWDWTTGTLVRQFRTRRAIHAMLVLSSGEARLELLIVSLRLSRADGAGRTLPDARRLFHYCGQKMTSVLERVTLDWEAGVETRPVVRRLFKTRGQSQVALSPTGDSLVFTDRGKVCLWRVGTEVESVRVLRHTSTITRIDFHPREPCLVLADVLGRIILWYCLVDVDSVMGADSAMGADGSHPHAHTFPQRTLHWHANEVTDFAFANDGQYLLSGGEEAVLVLWQVDGGQNQFLPRLGDPIHFVVASGDGRWAAVSLRNNVIHLVALTSGASLAVARSLTGLAHRVANSMTAMAMKDCPAVLIPGTPGSMQIYDPIGDLALAQLDLAPQNRPTRFGTRRGDRHRPLEVTHTAVSRCGRWMASVECRTGALTTRLKFWSIIDGRATLLTVVDRPHRDVVTDLAVWTHAAMPSVVSSSADGTFKLWGIDVRTGVWTCRFVGSYHDGAGGCQSVSVSPDGGLLAATFGPSITLWRLVGGMPALEAVLSATQTAQLAEARFIGNDALVAWCPDAGTFSFVRTEGRPFMLQWVLSTSPTAPIAVHPTRAQFAMAVASSEWTGVLAFAAQSAVPIGRYANAAMQTRALVYLPTPESVRVLRTAGCESHLLVALVGSGELVLLASEAASRIDRTDFRRRIRPGQTVPLDRVTAALERSRSLHRAIFDGVSQGRTCDELLDARAANVKLTMAELFAAVATSTRDELSLVASHVLPPVPLLFSHFMQRVLSAI